MPDIPYSRQTCQDQKQWASGYLKQAVDEPATINTSWPKGLTNTENAINLSSDQHLAPLSGVVINFTKAILPQIEAARQLTAAHALYSTLQHPALVEVTLPATPKKPSRSAQARLLRKLRAKVAL